jgi:hypothetical protein
MNIQEQLYKGSQDIAVSYTALKLTDINNDYWQTATHRTQQNHVE